MLVSVILTIVVLNFHFRGPKKQRVPRWMRRLIIGQIGKAFCFCYESKAFYMAHADNYYEIVNHSESNKKTEQNNKTKPKQLKFHERKPIETGTNKTPNDYKYYSNTTRKFSSNNKDVNNETDSDFENQVEPAYVKVSKIERNNLRNKENHIVLEYSDETDHCLSR